MRKWKRRILTVPCVLLLLVTVFLWFRAYREQANRQKGDALY